MTTADRTRPAAFIAGYRIGGVIRQSPLRSIYAATRPADAVPVVIKTLNEDPPTRQALAELRREFHITHMLQPVQGVVRVHALETYGHGNVAIILERCGISLAERLGAEPGHRFAPLRCLSIASAVAEVLAGVHQMDVVHKNITPGSILLDDAGELRLIDFAIASELSLERQHYALARRIEGKLPYISPEQTGRMNRDLDYRSDFYSLGVTLFELLTGRLPFHGGTVLEWVHAHISKVPPSPSEIDPSIPAAVSAIVLKLLAKNAEDRYQSSYGLINDLARCQRELTETGGVSAFPLGQRDVSRKFHIPQKLYGREPELAVLLALFDRVANGGTELCMVSGYSGIGKSALVNEISRALVSRQGYLVQGKFDQFQRSTPYSAVAVAFRSLVQQLLADTDQRRLAWRERLLDAVSPNGQLLIEMMPELERIIGAQPAVPDLPRTETQNRFQIAILNFVRVIAGVGPLVIFLDDLQFADASSLNLIRWLATAREMTHLLVVGAYRSNEVDVGHPLRLALNDIEETRPIHDLRLAPLGLQSVEHLVAGSLYCDPAACRKLAELLHDRAQGNPFFLTEMLKTLEQSRAIAFAPEAGRWRWDMDAVRRSGLGSDVVAFLLTNLRRLDARTQRVLQLAACIGNSFDLRTLAVIHQRPMDTTAEDLLPALQLHMIIPLHQDYKLVGRAAGAADAADLGGFNPTYRFQHDRVQQAAYALIADEDKPALRLSVGRLMQRHATRQEREERLIDIVGHLNAGRLLMTDEDERHQLVQANLAAGIKAQRSAAYATALGYLRVANELLPADRWTRDYRLAMALAVEYQQCAYLTGEYAEAEAWIERMLAHAASPLEKAEILSMRTRQYATMGKMEASIQSAIAGLSLLGMRITANPTRTAVARERALVRRNLAGRQIAALIDAPKLTDPPTKVAIRLLMEIFAAAFLSGSGNLFPFLVLKSVNLSLRYGNSAESAFAYAAYGMLLCGVLDDPALGYEFGKLAVAMNDTLDDIALKSRVIYLHTMFIHHWSNHWSSMTPWFRRGIEAGYQSGDMLYLAYSAQDCIIWDPKLDLETAVQLHADYLNIVRDCQYRDSLDSGTLFLQMQRNFLGWTDSLCSLNDAGFDEETCVAGMRDRKFMTGIANFHIYKAEICFFYGQYTEALEHVRAQDKLIASAMSLPQLVRFYIVAFLTLAACLPGMPAAEQADTRTRLHNDLRRMARWAKNCPANFLHLQLLMQAELARLAGGSEKALALYEQAMEAARTAEFRRDEAMANELAGRHLLAAGRAKAAEGYLRAARTLYERWGAHRKVAHMEAEFPHLLHRADAGGHGAAAPEAASLDMESVIKASQAISGELLLDNFWATTMRLMLENAGGQRGCFVVRRDGQLLVQGLSEVGQTAPAEATTFALGAADKMLPVSIIYHVLHTDTPVVLNDAARAGRFARDAYLLARKPQSVLCIPLVREGKFEGVIYMENSVASQVFTEDRIEVVKLLAAQASISIENATLYETQSRLVAAQSRFVPNQFLESLDYRDISRVRVGEHVVRTMGVMFADLRDSTTLAERLETRTFIDLLNRYFVAMEAEIVREGGFIDAFAGDGMKALFDTSAEAAVRAGIGMWRALEAFNRRSASLGQPELQMGIGINTGSLVLGVVGGNDRVVCSVIGDTVNLASRIEGLTKLYRARLLIGEQTYRRLSDPALFAIRMIDRVAVKGRNEAIRLYEVLDAEVPERRAAKLATRERLQAAMACYARREFAEARQRFEQLCLEDPEDAVPTRFAMRCTRYLQEPPPPDWEGFEKLNEK
jgi:predicted ATPase/class 3 adenylate cyclase